MKISTGTIRFIKGALSVMVAALVSYIADSANLTGFLNATVATIVAGMFLVIEGWVKDEGAGALFGVAKSPEESMGMKRGSTWNDALKRKPTWKD